MSKKLPLNTIKQASNDNLIKLIVENTLSGVDERGATLTPKQLDLAFEEAGKRGLYKFVELHHKLSTVVRLLRVDLDSQNYKNKWILTSIDTVLDEYLSIANLFIHKWLKPQDDSQAKYRDLVIKEIEPVINKDYQKDLYIDPWEFTTVSIKQYILKIRGIEKLINLPIVTADTKKFITQTRYVFFIQSGQITNKIKDIIHNYRTSPEFKAWLDKSDLTIDTFKEAKKAIDKHFDLPKADKDRLYKEIIKASNDKKAEVNAVYTFFEDYPLEEVGLNQKQKTEVTKFIDQIKDRYGITE